MTNAAIEILAAVARCAIRACHKDMLKDLLDRDLFSEVVPAADAGDVPKELADAMLWLYERLVCASESCQDVARAALQRIIALPETADAIPEAALQFWLEPVVSTNIFTRRDARALLRLPWPNALASLPEQLKSLGSDFAEMLTTAVHEADDGFVDDSQHDSALLDSARTLLAALRASQENLT